ncbi:Uncharacterised protein [Vibrio cholerae]|nr:Uncharacterised protein [Vibrio cholerae]
MNRPSKRVSTIFKVTFLVSLKLFSAKPQHKIPNQTIFIILPFYAPAFAKCSVNECRQTLPPEPDF